MNENIFLKDQKKLGLAEYMDYNLDGRGNLGEDIPVAVYRLMEYSLREELEERYGREEQIRVLRGAGFRAGVYFAKKMLDLTKELNQFVAQLQERMEELKIGVLRIEKYDEESGKFILTISEDADCSGFPLLGETVCNYDEGFISGVMTVYIKKEYSAEEVDCWATGDRVCRFRVEPKKS